MPIRYRRYYLQKLSEMAEKQQEEIDKKFGSSNNKELSQSNRKPKDKPPIPDFAFKARAPKK